MTDPLIRQRIFRCSERTITIFLIFIQYFLTASSIYFLAELARSVSSGSFFISNLYSYFLLILGGHVFGMYSSIFLEKWKIKSIEQFTIEGQAVLSSKVAMFPDGRKKEKMTSMYSKVGPMIVASYPEYIYQLLSAMLMSVTTILIMAFVVDELIIVSYLISVVLCALIIFKYGKLLKVTAYTSERKLLTLTGALSSVWDNLVIGNTLNKDAWGSNKVNFFKHYRTAKVRSTTARCAVQLVLSFAAFIPTILIVIFLIQYYGVASESFIVLLVALPKIVQVINSMTAMMTIIAQYNFVKGTLVLVDQFFNETKMDDLDKRIKFQEITVAGAPSINASQSTDQWCKSLSEKGRVTIQADNGTGKTSLLLSMKEYFGERSFYLPAMHNLFFLNQKDGSTGEQVIQIIDEISKQKGIDIFLLDEWDANLDSNKVISVSRKLDELVMSGKMVVEVRHKL